MLGVGVGSPSRASYGRDGWQSVASPGINETDVVRFDVLRTSSHRARGAVGDLRVPAGASSRTRRTGSVIGLESATLVVPALAPCRFDRHVQGCNSISRRVEPYRIADRFNGSQGVRLGRAGPLNGCDRIARRRPGRSTREQSRLPSVCRPLARLPARLSRQFSGWTDGSRPLHSRQSRLADGN